jgi:hypothetical protein
MTGWILRGLLAGLLLLASEMLLWTNPPGRAPQDWLLLMAGYAALAALLLDFAARYRIRDVYGLLALAGLYGLLNGLLLNPQTALADVPLTWATRVMGAHTLVGFGMLALLLGLNAGHRLRVWAAAALVGLLWGVWVRWLPTFTDIAAEIVPLSIFLLTAAPALLPVIALAWLAKGRAVEAANLKLRLVERLPVAAVLVGLYIVRQPDIDQLSLVVLGVLAGFCWLLLWFQKRDGGAMLLDSALPLHSSAPMTLLIAGGIALAGGALGYHLEFAETGPLDAMIGLFAAFGLVWLPTVSLVLGVRAYRQMGRTQKL